MYKVYSKENCPICEQAIESFIAHKIAYQEIVIGRDITRDEVIKQHPNTPLAPVIVSPDGYEIPAQYLELLLTLEERRLKNG